ncbi:MAG: GNAT family N-acetyltransferase [Planctomycetes bacterium]|nr:GNAT family N-acetyltransferase [Planctomycetota bacterium]
MITWHVDESLRVEEIEPFFADWKSPPGRARREALLSGSDVVVSAREDGKLVGLLTAISDGALHALITILKVLPSHRHRGIGTDLLKKAMEELGPIYDVTLISDSQVAPFYEPHGFRPGFSMTRRDLGAAADP